jgi:hypothetical protein
MMAEQTADVDDVSALVHASVHAQLASSVACSPSGGVGGVDMVGQEGDAAERA